MNPGRLLSLWRERWGKADSQALKRPYLEGKITRWGRQLANSSVWSWPGVSVLLAVLCVVLFVLVLTAPLALNSQISFAILMGSLALYLRRHTGTLITLTLIGLSFMASTRYLYWRFSASLGQEFNADLIFGFGLCIAELYFGLLTALGYVSTLWPLKRTHAPLPTETPSWPTVDVFIPCHDQPPAAILSAAQSALALDWPQKKIHTYLLDGASRDDIQALADSLGVTYLAYPDNADDRTGQINRALSETKGQLIVIFDDQQALHPHFLQQSVGWFMQDMKLGMLQTLHHFLAPAPEECCAEIMASPALGGSYAVIRRSMLMEAGGVETAPVTAQTHTALTLQALGYSHAYIGFTESSPLPEQNLALSGEPPCHAGSKIFRVDHPFLGGTLRWKLRLSSMQTLLQGYNVVARLIFLMAPVVYLLAGVRLIQAPIEVFAAYALPHLVQHLIAQARLQGRRRFTFWTSLREMVLACYMLVRTAMSVTRAELDCCKRAVQGEKAEKKVSFSWHIALPYVIVFVLNLSGLIVGSVHWPVLSPSAQELAVLYLLWSAYNLMLLAAQLAVAEEVRDIQLHTRLQLNVPAMIKLSSGRSIFCVTQNFPDAVLALKLPTPVTIDSGLPVNMSVFYGDREFSFPVRVESHQDMILHVTIEATAQHDYRTLCVAARSRGEHWPKWLPERDADHPLPPWVTQQFATLSVWARAFATNFGNRIRGLASIARFKNGKKND